MKLWLISQDENNNYDTYDAAVVAAETEEAARNTYPSETGSFADPRHRSGWASSPAKVKTKLLGDALPGTTAGVVLASFNAG